MSIIGGQIDTLLDNLDHKVEIQIDRSTQLLNQYEAKSYIQNWMKTLENPQIVRLHPAPYNKRKNTYGLYHIQSGQDSFRFFYFSSLDGSSHKISKVKIIKV